MTQSKFMNPYLAGFFLGLLLLVTIFITGRGLGASGAAKSAVIAVVNSIVPSHTADTKFYVEYMEEHNGSPLKNWLVFEVIGVIIGAFASGLIAGRVSLKLEHSPKITSKVRTVAALFGGLLFGLGAQLGRGCTSGSALSGMAVLSAGGIITMLAIFGGAYAFAYFFRKLWI
jgi:hypothetical protein